MRRLLVTRSVVGSALGALVVAASACATSPGAFSTAQTNRSSSIRSASSTTHFNIAALRDSMRAQAIADQEGPRVSVNVEVSGFASSPRVRASFRVDDDAYVLLGHLDADGILRIVFPNDPADNGFVQGGKTYRLPEFSAGFGGLSRYRQASNGLYRSYAARSDSYDGGAGYVFVIASWRPMRFDRFSEGNEWDSFEITNDQYLRDPRPAIYELATLLTGENREAYTVKFARFFSTRSPYVYGGSFASSAYGSSARRR